MTEFKITALRKQRGALYIVEREGEPAVELDRRTVEEQGLAVGAVLTESAWAALCEESACRRAKERALWLLSQKDYSQNGLVRKLRETVDREHAEAAAARMVELGFVDDERYAERLARELCLVRQLPVRRAAQKMAEKGLSRDWIEAAVEAVGADDVQAALAHLNKMCYNDTDNEPARRKLCEKLVRMGFSYDAVRRAARQLDEERD